MLHGESSKRLASQRNTKDRKHLQSTQTTHLTDQAPSTTERTSRETHNTRRACAHASLVGSDSQQRICHRRAERQACLAMRVWDCLPAKTKSFQIQMADEFEKHVHRIPFSFFYPNGEHVGCQPAAYHGRVSAAKMLFVVAWKGAFANAARKCRAQHLPKLGTLACPEGSQVITYAGAPADVLGDQVGRQGAGVPA